MCLLKIVEIQHFFTSVRFLHELDAEFVEPFARLVDVGHGDADVTEAARIRVAVVVLGLVSVTLGTPVALKSKTTENKTFTNRLNKRKQK